MYKLSLQLKIESFLSNGKPYLASHPELGVPLGVFNTYDEPDYTSRIKSIRKFGKKGNPLSLLLAKKLGVKNPIPSYLGDVVFKDSNGVEIKINKSEFDKVLRKEGYTKGSTGSDNVSRDYDVFGEAENVLLELSKQRTQADLTLRDTMGMIQSLAGLADGGAGDKTRASMEAYLDILSLTDTMRKGIIKEMGMDEIFMDDIILSITSASKGLAGFALTANDVYEVLQGVTEETGRAFLIPKEALINATKLEELYDIDMANVISEFDKIGVGSIEATETTNRAIATAGRYGATVSKLLPKVQQNIAKINTYGFKNGVDGLTKMVAEAQVLGYNFENAMQMADKAFTPEGAIEMAAKLQMIGGAASELLDPFQLMYMAQNDVEGLQDAIVKTAESAVMFNKETGEFGISPGERMRLKAMAEATGQDYTNLAETAIKAAKRTQAIGKLGGIPELSQQDKELIASMADIQADGTFKIKLGDMGEDLSFSELQKAIVAEGGMQGGIMDKLRTQSEKDAMDLDAVNKAQLTVQEGMAANTALIQNLLTEAAASGVLGTSAQELASQIAKSGLGDELLSGTIIGGKDLGSLLSGAGGAIGEVADKASGESLGNAFRGSQADFEKRNQSPASGGLYYGGGLETSNPQMTNPKEIENYLQNTPEGQDLINNYVNNTLNTNTQNSSGGKEVKVVFSPLEIKYDGNTIKLTPNQVREVLPPLFDEIALGVSKSGQKSTTP